MSRRKQDVARFVSCFFMCVSCKSLMKGETRVMNQQKIGTFLKELRNEKNLRKISWQKNWAFHAERFPVGRQGAICLIWIFRRGNPRNSSCSSFGRCNYDRQECS